MKIPRSFTSTAVLLLCGVVHNVHAATPIYEEGFSSAWAFYSSDGSTPFLSTTHGSWYVEPQGYVHGMAPADAEVWLDHQGPGEDTPKLTFSFVTLTALTDVKVSWDGYFCDGCSKTPSDTSVAFSLTGSGGGIAGGTINGDHLPYLLTWGNVAAGTYAFTWDPVGTSNYRFDNFKIEGNVSPVPEPETAAMLIGGLAVLGAMRRRRRPSSR